MFPGSITNQTLCVCFVVSQSVKMIWFLQIFLSWILSNTPEPFVLFYFVDKKKSAETQQRTFLLNFLYNIYIQIICKKRAILSMFVLKEPRNSPRTKTRIYMVTVSIRTVKQRFYKTISIFEHSWNCLVCNRLCSFVHGYSLRSLLTQKTQISLKFGTASGQPPATHSFCLEDILWATQVWL